MQNFKVMGILIAVVSVSIGQTGCSMKPESLPSTGFTNESVMTEDPTLPFQKVWIKPGFDKSKYKKLYVADVNTSYMLGMTDWQEGMRKGDFQEDVNKLALYTQDSVKKAFREDPYQRFSVVDSPTKTADTLIAEIAITEVVPSKVVLNALGYAPFGIGLAIKAVRMAAKDRSTVAFEARFRDASTREVVAMISDREAEQAAVVSVRGLTWYSQAYNIINTWSKQFVEIANRQPGQTVEDMKSFTLKPW